jgi:glutamate formiminotransferase
MKLLESVPNISEGRRPAVVRRLAEALGAPGVRLLDASSDPDHHRSVFTAAGDPDALHRGLLRLVETALHTLDLRQHVGVHPRVGAVDVVPFVPLGDATMEDAVNAARRLGRAVGERLEVPVFLYGQAHPEGRTLADIRRGSLDGAWPAIPDGDRIGDHRNPTPPPVRWWWGLASS